MRYPLVVEDTSKGYVATLTGFDSGQFRSKVRERLVVLADVYLHYEYVRCRRNRIPFPLPVAVSSGQLAVTFTAVQMAKIYLWNAMVEAGEYTGRELAARLEVSQQTGINTLDLHHNTIMAKLEAALALYGKQVSIVIQQEAVPA